MEIYSVFQQPRQFKGALYGYNWVPASHSFQTLIERLWGQVFSENDSFRSPCFQLIHPTGLPDFTWIQQYTRMQPHQLSGSALLLHPSCTNFSHLSITLADGATAINCHVCTLLSCSWPIYSLNKALLCWSTAFVRTFVLAQLCSRAIILNPVLIEGN